MHSKLTKFLCLQLQFIPDLSRFLSTNRQQTELLKRANAASISGSFGHVVLCFPAEEISRHLCGPLPRDCHFWQRAPNQLFQATGERDTATERNDWVDVHRRRASDKDSGNASSDSHHILIQIVTKEYRSLPTVDMENLTSIQERRAVPSRARHVCIPPPASPSPEAQGDISNAEPECWKLGEALHSALRRKQASECAAEYESRHDLYWSGYTTAFRQQATFVVCGSHS